MALASDLGSQISRIAINQAYFYSAGKLKREIFVKPDILDLSADQLLQAVKPLYNLIEADEYWGETLTAHNFDKLRTRNTSEEFSLFLKKSLW